MGFFIPYFLVSSPALLICSILAALAAALVVDPVAVLVNPSPVIIISLLFLSKLRCFAVINIATCGNKYMLYL